MNLIKTIGKPRLRKRGKVLVSGIALASVFTLALGHEISADEVVEDGELDEESVELVEPAVEEIEVPEVEPLSELIDGLAIEVVGGVEIGTGETLDLNTLVSNPEILEGVDYGFYRVDKATGEEVVIEVIDTFTNVAQRVDIGVYFDRESGERVFSESVDVTIADEVINLLDYNIVEGNATQYFTELYPDWKPFDIDAVDIDLDADTNLYASYLDLTVVPVVELAPDLTPPASYVMNGSLAEYDYSAWLVPADVDLNEVGTYEVYALGVNLGVDGAPDEYEIGATTIQIYEHDEIDDGIGDDSDETDLDDWEEDEGGDEEGEDSDDAPGDDEIDDDIIIGDDEDGEEDDNTGNEDEGGNEEDNQDDNTGNDDEDDDDIVDDNQDDNTGNDEEGGDDNQDDTGNDDEDDVEEDNQDDNTGNDDEGGEEDDNQDGTGNEDEGGEEEDNNEEGTQLLSDVHIPTLLSLEHHLGADDAFPEPYQFVTNWDEIGSFVDSIYWEFSAAMQRELRETGSTEGRIIIIYNDDSTIFTQPITLTQAVQNVTIPDNDNDDDDQIGDDTQDDTVVPVIRPRTPTTNIDIPSVTGNDNNVPQHLVSTTALPQTGVAATGGIAAGILALLGGTGAVLAGRKRK